MRLYYSIIVTLFFRACYDGTLRGREVKSQDQKTYLVIEDDNGGNCGPIKLDGSIWKYNIGEAGEVQPGTHIIECAGKIEFRISEGVIFYFDYWGP